MGRGGPLAETCAGRVTVGKYDDSAWPVTGQALAGQRRIDPRAPPVRLNREKETAMKFAGALTLALVAASAEARPLRLNPPKEFDHPYTGYLITQIAKDQDEVRRLCNAKFTQGIAPACSYRVAPDKRNPLGSCTIIMLPEEQLEALGLPLYLIWRHEIAHCNGWPGDHNGARPFYEWATEEVPPAEKATGGGWTRALDPKCYESPPGPGC
jgi:hypothetical protein